MSDYPLDPWLEIACEFGPPPCPDCEGEGEIKGEECPKCRGDGRDPEWEPPEESERSFPYCISGGPIY